MVPAVVVLLACWVTAYLGSGLPVLGVPSATLWVLAGIGGLAVLRVLHRALVRLFVTEEGATPALLGIVMLTLAGAPLVTMLLTGGRALQPQSSPLHAAVVVGVALWMVHELVHCHDRYLRLQPAD